MTTTLARALAALDALAPRIEAALEPSALGLAARMVFAAVLCGYYRNSALTKIGDGVPGVFTIADAAYFQIVPPVVEAYGYDASAVPVLPWGLVVAAGTWAEFLLPVLIVLGLATRLAALGMIVFVAVQSYVVIAFHGVDAAAIGALFDRQPGSVILDQRTLWVLLFATLAVKGAGALSLDALIRRRLATARVLLV